MENQNIIEIKKVKNNEENIDEVLIETNKKKMVESVIQKWLMLQKTIKEEMTLEDVTTKHQENELIQLKNKYKDYYETKLESRQIISELNDADDSNTKSKKLIIGKNNLTFINISEPINNLLFIFRENNDYILKLISLMSFEKEKGEDDEKISSLIELFCNQFYENILIPNPEQEDLLLLICKLLEMEISPMDAAYCDDFLNEDTFLDKFISSLIKRQEVKIFLSSVINPLLIDIDNNNSEDNYLGISLLSINDYIDEIKQNKKYKNKKFDKEDFKDWNELEDFLLNNITKTSIIFKNNKKEKKHLKKEIEKKEEDEESAEESEEESEEEENNEEILENLNNSIYIKNDKDKEEEENNINNEINHNYKEMLDLDFLEREMNNEKNEEIKSLYIYELQQITYEEDIFSNKGLLEVLKEEEFRENRKEIVKKYKSNFIFIKQKIDLLIQSLIDKIESIPYIVRCICKIIFLLLQKRFPSLNCYTRNSFIGKYIFEKCIFPILNLSNRNILEPRIISVNIKKCLNVIISVLSYANKSMLFNYNIDTEKTIFNHYILELIPILNKFYEELINIELPPILNYLVKSTESSIDIKDENNNNEDSLEEKDEKKLGNNYFMKHSDELINVECICFSFDDLLTILSLIGKNIQAFSGLPHFDVFQKAYNYIKEYENLICDEIKKEKDQKNFFLAFKTEKNDKFEKSMKNHKTSIFTSEDQDSDLITQRFKFCIKTVLKGLNLLNNKDYPYLNMAISNRKFFSALKYILDDFGELSEIEDKIPLKWYGQYIFNNKDGLEKQYKEDDYLNLYNEINEEESKILKELKSRSSISITRDGINIECAEKKIQKEKFDNYQIKQAKEFLKIEKFVEEEKIEVCITINSAEEIKKFKEKNKKGEKNKTILPLNITEDVNCIHRVQPSKNMEPEKIEKIPYHAYNIKDFINKFSEDPWEGNNLNYSKKPLSLVKEDIEKGSDDNEINNSFHNYMTIIKKHIRKSNYFDLKNSNISDITDKIEDYIMRKLYDYVYPKNELKDDIEFYKQTQRLKWMLPEHLDIKKLYMNQLTNAVLWIKKLDEAKSIKEKLICIGNVYNTMNNIIKFSSGKDDNSGQDELTPIFQYLIIKAQPKRFFSNINYIKCFLHISDLTGQFGFLFTQMDSSASFIMNLDYTKLKITEEEYNKNMREAEEKIKLIKI